MPLPEDSQAANKSTTGTPSEVRLARNTQLCGRDNSLVCKRCQADPILREGQPLLLPATGPAQEPGCWHSFQGWDALASGDGAKRSGHLRIPSTQRRRFLKQTIVINGILAMPIAGHNMLLKGYPRSTMLRTKRKLVRFGGRRVTQVFQAKEQY